MRLVTREELTEWFDMYGGHIIEVFRECRIAKQVAEDLTHEVFLRALRWSGGRQIKCPCRYLCRIAKNVAVTFREKESRRARHHALWLRDQRRREHLSRNETTMLLRAEVRACVEELPLRQKQVITLLMEEDPITYPQLAKRLCISERAILRDITSAYAALRGQLKDFGRLGATAHWRRRRKAAFPPFEIHFPPLSKYAKRETKQQRQTNAYQGGKACV